ncbi:MAG: hypothetical protein ACE361_20105 [Aureliella sp.]
MSTIESIETRPSTGARNAPFQWLWIAGLVIWFLAVSFLPNPRPFGAPEFAVSTVVAVTGLSEPAARAVATIVLRATGLGILGALVACSCGGLSWRVATLCTLFAAPTLATISLWINIGYFPILAQLWLSSASGVIGGFVGLGLLRNKLLLLVAFLFTGSLFMWGTATGISDDLSEATAATARHLLNKKGALPESGDERFTAIVREAFAYAHDNSHQRDARFANQAAILAIGVLVGDENVAEVARRAVPQEALPQLANFRKGITLQGRADLPRHFSVSAALAVLSDEERSLSVGVAKEMMDATPGGSGFSFVDLMADRAGILFAVGATRTSESAKEAQQRMTRDLSASDLCPTIEDLPEGLTQDEFREQFGGLGGVEASAVMQDIGERLRSCDAILRE